MSQRGRQHHVLAGHDPEYLKGSSYFVRIIAHTRYPSRVLKTKKSPVDLTANNEHQLAVRIGRAWRDIRRGAAASAIRDRIFGSGPDALEPGQVDTLDLLVQQDEWRMCDLATALHIDPSTATRAIQRLIPDGLAERVVHDGDGRVVKVRVTQVGRDRHADIAARRLAVLSHVLAEYSPDERIQVADLFERFVVALDNTDAELAQTQTPTA
ncbi:MAG: MarR family transcriptional regulator [Actinobacteria bacterium]|nr:MAG: MarR family transcriptional regulator [Actinomycetota bacterium]